MNFWRNASKDMSEIKRCFYLPLEGQDTDIVRQGVFWLFANAKLAGGGWFAVNMIGNLENYSTYPGLNDLIKLKNKYNHAIINGVPVYLITKDEYLFPTDGMNRPMLAVHPTRDLLDKLDNIPNISQMTVIPWLGKEIQDWIELHGAVILQPDAVFGENNKRASSDLDPIVAAALEDYSKRVDFKQNVWENDVKFGSIALFRILIGNGIDYDPEAIREYLLTKLKWKPLAADQTARVADVIRSGDEYRKIWPDISEPWRTKFWSGDYDGALHKWRMMTKDSK